jgi:hypothetical protein
MKFNYVLLFFIILIISWVSLFGDSNILAMLYSLQSYIGLYIWRDEGFENQLTIDKSDEDITKHTLDCRKHGYNSAKMIDGKVYCTLDVEGLNIKGAQQCVLTKTLKAGDNLKEHEYYCESNTRKNRRKKRKALRAFYANNPEYYEIPRNARIDMNKSTPLLQFHKMIMNNGKKTVCYKPAPPVSNAADIEKQVLDKYPRMNILPCSECHTGFEPYTNNNLEKNGIGVCIRPKYKTKVWVRPSNGFRMLGLGKRNNKIPLRVIYNKKDYERTPENILYRNITLGNFRPWGWDKKIKIERKHAILNSYMNIRGDLDLADYIFYNITVDGDTNEYIVFYPVSELVNGAASFLTIPWRIEGNDADYSQTERRIAIALTDQINIGSNLRKYILSLANNDKFLGDLKKNAKYPSPVREEYYETKGRLFRRRRVKKYRITTRNVPLSSFEKANPELFERAMNDAKSIINGLWKGKYRRKMIRKYMSIDATHDEKLNIIDRLVLKKVIRELSKNNSANQSSLVSRLRNLGIQKMIDRD